MRRYAVALLTIVAAATLAGARTRAVRVSSPFGAPVPGLTAEQRLRFDAGLAEFIRARTVADGLGPVFNGPDCRQCHHSAESNRSNTPGGGSDNLVTRIGTITDGAFDPLAQFG